jgi:two-component system, response regulator, stage 0 sporulation protein F
MIDDTCPLILLVDDDSAVRAMMARALIDRGYAVRTAADGQAALTILQGLETLPAIAITDLCMAGFGGEELARTLTRLYPDLPVIFMTGHLALYRIAYLPGPILEKPFHADQLCDLLASVLTAAAEARGLQTTVSQSGRREARLRTEFAYLYPPLEAGHWEPAFTTARRLLDWLLQAQRGRVSGDRLLPKEHFEFRGISPRPDTTHGNRTRMRDAA